MKNNNLYTIKKKSLDIRLFEDDIEKIKIIALEKSIPLPNFNIFNYP